MTLLAKAKRGVFRKRPTERGRKWLLVGHVDPYGGESNRVTVWALEGSPVRGFLHVYVDHADLFNGVGERIADVWDVDDE
jgi:hypothetical protein